MAANPTYSELERKIQKLEKEAIEYLRKEKEFARERKLIDYGHMKRTLSLMRINEELNKEINEIKSVALLVEREWAEEEIRKCRNKIE